MVLIARTIVSARSQSSFLPVQFGFLPVVEWSGIFCDSCLTKNFSFSSHNTLTSDFRVIGLNTYFIIITTKNIFEKIIGRLFKL